MTVGNEGTFHWDYRDEQLLHRVNGKGVILHDTIKCTVLVTSCEGKIRYLRKDTGKDRSDEKTRKKTSSHCITLKAKTEHWKLKMEVKLRTLWMTGF
jgi:hypothetical protein